MELIKENIIEEVIKRKRGRPCKKVIEESEPIIEEEVINNDEDELLSESSVKDESLNLLQLISILEELDFNKITIIFEKK